MTIHVVSYSEISTFRQCPHKWQMGYRERWTNTLPPSPALQKGTLFHSVMEAWYKWLRSERVGEPLKITSCVDPRVEEFVKTLGPLLYKEDGSQTKTQELVLWMFLGYVQQWGEDAEWKILAAEHDAEVWLPTVTGRRSNFRLKMKIDLIARHIPTGRLWIWDHKTGANLPNDKELSIDDQFGLYTWGMRQLGKKIWGAYYNAARTQRNKGPMALSERFSRTPIYRTDRELDTIAVEAYLTSKRMYAIKEGMAERSPNTDTCKWKCDILEACLAGRKGVDERQFLKDVGFKQDFTRH